MAKRLLVSCVLALSALSASAAFASTAQDQMTPPQATFMYNVPYATSYGSDGQYVESGTYYNDAPVYTRAGTAGSGITWSLYKRSNGSWVVDFNTVSEDWDGTVAYTVAAQAWPWSTTAWNNSVVSFRTQSVYVNNVPYADSGSNGDYTITGQIYNGAPVFARTGSGGITWSLYKRSTGYWAVDYNTVSEDWDGTVANTSSAATWPWTASSWNNSSYLAFITKEVLVYQIPQGAQGSMGLYTFANQFYNNAPVYKRQTPGPTFSLYRRGDGKWNVDNNAISEAPDGTVIGASAASAWPWDATWPNNGVVFRNESLSASGAPYASSGSAGTYFFSGQIYNNAPVYQRAAGGTTWSIYKRSAGSWYVDFSAVAEDWDGTVAYTTAAASWPWSGTWNASTVTTPLFDQ